VQAFKIKTNRLQALHTLTGGSPRLLIILYILVQSSVENISDLETGFYNLLEELTPYFQARMAQLGANEEKVLVAFAEGPEQLTPAEVGCRIRMATNVVTATLKRLQSAGFIKRIEQPIKGRKGTLYRLSETIFRYWYQINSERSREMAEIFVKFIVLFYTYPEIKKIYTSQQIGSQKTEKAITMASAAPQKLRYLEAAMDKLRTTETGRLLASLKEKRKGKAPHNTIRKIFDELIEINPDDPTLLNLYAVFLCELGDLETAIPLFRKTAELCKQKEYKTWRFYAYNNWGTALLALAKLKGDEGLFQESFEKYALAVKYKQDDHEAYNNWGTALLALAELKGDEGLFQESFEKYVTAWSLIKRLAKLDHPLMVNTGLKTVMGACIVGEGDEADHTFMEIVGILSKVVDLKATTPYFFDFFESLPRKAEIAVARNYLEQLLKSKFKKELRVLVPFRFFYEYLEHHDDTIIRRQPPEIQKVLNEMIRRAEKRE